MRRSIRMLRGKKGFTLIELIVVLAVLAIIMAIAVPRFVGVREQAKVDADMATLASIAKLAEFEFVRLNKDISKTSFEDTTVVPKLITENFSESNFFQSENMKSKIAGDVDVTFNGKGKVDVIIVNPLEFEYSDGKFVAVEPTTP